MTEDSHATKGMGMAGEMGGGAARFARLRPLPLGKLQAPVGIGGSVSTPDPDHGLLQQTPHGDAVGPCEVHLQNRDGLSSRSFARPRLSHSAPTLRRHSLPPSPNSDPPRPPNLWRERGCPPEGGGTPPLLSVAQAPPALPGDAKAKRVGAPSAEEATQCPSGRSPRRALGWRSAAVGSAL